MQGSSSGSAESTHVSRCYFFFKNNIVLFFLNEIIWFW